MSGGRQKNSEVNSSISVYINISFDSLLLHMPQFQDINGNDVLYVWTHLNLRGGDDTGISHNMTYELGT